MRNTIRYLSLMFTIWGSAVFIKFMPIKPEFEENPLFALVIALVASFIYRATDEG